MEKYNILSALKEHFVVKQFMENEDEIVLQIKQGVTFTGPNLWVLVFAIFIASLGLNVNSTAVIIGAMLISPLMGPIIGMGLAVGINDLELLKRAARNFGVATVISVITATFYFLITPLGEAQSELLARTSPTIYDVLIATFGGAAGILAICTKGKGNVLPGVAIATALMPPLCTAGYGLATGNILFFLGAFYLFFINTVFISLATYVGVRLMNFRKKEFLSPAAEKKARHIITALVIITILPAAAMTYNIVRKSIQQNNISTFIHKELQQNGTQIISSALDTDKKTLNIIAVGKEITDSTITAAQHNMRQYRLNDIKLNIIQGEQGDSLYKLNSQISQITTTRQNDQKKIIELTAEVSNLTNQLNEYKQYENITADIRKELNILFPQISTITISKATQADTRNNETKHFVAAIISTDNRKPLTQQEKTKLGQWLQERVKADSLVIY